jgi:hypothetical protein
MKLLNFENDGRMCWLLLLISSFKITLSLDVSSLGKRRGTNSSNLSYNSVLKQVATGANPTAYEFTYNHIASVAIA